MTQPPSVGIVGAGIYGLSAALWLRRAGHPVTLFDRIEPGDPAQTSYGNAGLIARSSVIPVPTPGLLAHVPAMLLHRDGPLFLRWRYLPRLLPWLVPFLRTAKAEQVRRTASALADLLGDGVDQHLALASGTDAARHIRTGHYTFLYTDRAAYEKDGFGFALRRELGYVFDEKDREALVAEDPALAPDMAFGVSARDHGWIADPGAYMADLLAAFRREGGTFLRASVDEIAPGPPHRIVAGGETLEFERIVLAAGVWSRRLAERLGHRIAMESERGYHLLLKGPSLVPPVPYMVQDSKFAVTPMAAGIRCAGLVEFGGLDAPPSAAPVDLLRRRIRRLYPALTWEEEETWMGHRPSTTDSLPVIGESPALPGIWFGFGAQHVGLTSGPKAGRLIADAIAGRHPNIDMSPFRVDRFDR